MAPPSAGAVRRVATSRPGSDTGTGTSRRPPLQVVPRRRGDRAWGRLIKYLPVAMVVVALLIVVAGQAMLANGQVRMARIDQQLQIAQSEHRQQVLEETRLETPSRIVGAATSQLHMTLPSHVTQLPSVSLNTPLPAPNVTPAPATSAAGQ
jgi:cell division protein FtsL